MHPGRITRQPHGRTLHHGPREHAKLDRGTLTPGAPADITIFDTDFEWTYDVQQSYLKEPQLAFHGRRFRGGPVATIVGGEIVWKWNRRVITGGIGAQPSPAFASAVMGLVICFVRRLSGARWAASLLIDYAWWKEAGPGQDLD